jgi:hypothetical protein
VADTFKFPDLAQHNYMESRGEGPSSAPLLEPTQWIMGLYNACIMNLLDIPHFGRGKHINGCVKQLLARVHEGILWMDRLIPINVDLIAAITRLPTDGENPKKYLEDKTKAESISDEIKEKFGTKRGNKEIRISDISDHAARFATRLIG